MVLVEHTVLGRVAGFCVTREDVSALRHHAAVPRRMLHHVARQKTDATAINAVVDPDGTDRRLLLPLHQNLHLTEAHNDIIHHHLPAVEVLLTGAPLVAALHPNNLHNNVRR